MALSRCVLFALSIHVALPVAAGMAAITIPPESVTASSVGRNGSPHKPWFALDANLNTMWCSEKGTEHWLAVDLGSAYRVKNVAMTHAGYCRRERNRWDLNNTDFELRGGEKPQELTPLGRVTGNPTTEEAGISKFRGIDKTIRYLRLLVTKTPDGRARVSELVIVVEDPDGEEARIGTALTPSDQEKQNLKVHIVPHSSIDVAWLWRYDPETIEDCVRVTWRRAVENLQTYPAYSFTASQVPLYEPIENRHPELWEKLEAFIKEGRWEVAGGSYVEFEGAGPCGEALVRQFVHGKRYFKQKFDVDVTTAWQLQTRSHPATLPQILKRCRIDTYYLVRGAPEDQFLWEGLDGSRVLAVRPLRTTRPERIVAGALRSARHQERKHTVVLAGGGDHGGGLEAAEIEELQAMVGSLGLQAAFSRADRYAAEARKETAKLATVRGELGSQFPGAYTTLGKIKNGNRASENLLLTAERFMAAASRYQPYPRDTLRAAWNLLLFNQSHAILGGCVIPPAYEDTLRLYTRIEELARPLLDQALQGLLMHINTRGIPNPVVVFNPLSWARDGEVLIPAPPGEGAWIVRDDTGRFGGTQIIFDPQTQTNNLLFVAKDVPPFGYRTYAVLPSPQEVFNPCKVASGRMETPAFEITFEKGTGDMSQIRSKSFSWEILTGRGNRIHVLEDRGDSEGRLDLTGRSRTLGPFITMDVNEQGPVRIGLRVRNKLLGEHTTFVREIFLTNGLPWVDCRTYIEWNGEQKFVKVAFPVAVTAAASTWDIPYGTATRPNDGAERPALRWVDISDKNRGVALLNLNRYGYDVTGSTIRLSLLRSPTFPAHNDDGGTHTVPYALYPHLGSWRTGEVHRRAREYNVPLIGVPVTEHSGALPARASFFQVEPANIMITAVKGTEDGRGLVLRLVEVEGRPAANGALRSQWFLRNVSETNLLEEPGKELSSEGDLVKLSFRPHEIKTLLLKDWGYAPFR